MNKRFRIVRDIVTPMGTLAVGNTITVLHGHVLYNDGPVQPQFIDFFFNILEEEKKNGYKHLREIGFPKPVDFSR